MVNNRKIRVFLIANDSALRRDICELLKMEDYEVFSAPDSMSMDIVHDVFKPDIVMIYDLKIEQQKEIIQFFSIHLNHPLLLLLRKWQYQANYDFYKTLAPRTCFIYAPFTIDDILDQIKRLTAEVKADIDWLSASVVDNSGD